MRRKCWCGLALRSEGVPAEKSSRAECMADALTAARSRQVEGEEFVGDAYDA